MFRAVLLAAAVLPLILAGPAAAAPLAIQIVPVAEYIGPGLSSPFGLAYDPVNQVIWAKSTSGDILQSVRAFNTFTAGELALMGNGPNGKIVTPFFSNITTTTSPISGLQALGYHSPSGLLVIMDPATQQLVTFAPGGPIVNPNFAAVIVQNPPALFLDGLDIQGGDYYYSAEGAVTGQDSQKNGVIFLDNTSLAQTDLSGVWTGPGAPTITRWSGIEFVEGINRIFTVAEIDFGAGRTIASYDGAGLILGVDPDGNPFAIRLEDLAFDGRYLYGSDFATDRIFVFDVIGPGGLEEVPEPTSLAICGIVALGLAGVAAHRRRRAG